MWGTLLNTNQGLVDSAVAGVLTKSVAGSSNVVLTNTNGAADEERNQVFVFTGVLTGNINVLFPATKTKAFVVKNSTTGAFTLSVGVNNGSGSPAGTTIIVPASGTLPLWSDGTNVAAVVTAFVNPTFTGTVTMPDGATWTSASGISNLTGLGIGMVPATGPIDCTSASAGQPSIRTLNPTNGVGSAMRMDICAQDYSHSLTLARYPAASTGTLFGRSLANSSIVIDNSLSSGGLFIGTSTSSPIIVGVNGGQVAQFGTDGSFLVGSTTNAGAGSIAAVGNITAFYSDDRLKTRLGNIESALDKVCSLTGFYYEPNEMAKSLGYLKERHVGLSAQDVEKVMPEVIAPAPVDKQYMTIRYSELVPLLVEAIKELRKEIAAK